MATIQQIANAAGVSDVTVSNVLNGRIKGVRADAVKRADRIRRIAQEMGYRPHASARALRGQRSRMIGVLLCNSRDQPLHNMVAMEFVFGVNLGCQEADYSTLLIRADDLRHEGAALRVFREQLVDGLIVVGYLPPAVEEQVRLVGCETVWLDSSQWAPQGCVRRDEVAAGRLPVEHLVGLGRRRLALVGREPSLAMHHSHEHRRRGFEAAAQEQGVEHRFVAWPQSDEPAWRRILDDLFANQEAIVTDSVPMAKRIYSLATEMGRCAGRDYLLACCDDSFDVTCNWRSLTRVGFDRYRLGIRAAQMLLGRLDAAEGAAEADVASVEVRGPLVAGSTTLGPRD